jgi:hypothetical protein
LDIGRDVAPSPLALIFQPLVVDDDIIPEEPEEGEGLGTSESTEASVIPLVSYGPASRRRLMSLNQRRPTQAAADASAQAAGMRWGAMTLAHKALSQSPEQGEQAKDEDEEIPEPETAAEVEEEEEAGGGEPRMARRLKVMEERQKRIEDLLIQLNNKMP